jgi:hypothetical protein
MTTKLHLTQKGRDLIRVAASIAAYTVIGCLGAGFLYVFVWSAWVVGQAMHG